MKQREILAAVRARSARRDGRDNVGGASAQVVPTEFVHAATRSVAASTKTSDWAAKLQAERNAQRSVQEPGGSEDTTQPDRKEADAVKVPARGAKPRNTRSRKPASS